MNDHLACGKKVPEKWLDGKSKLHVQMASDLWGGSRDGNASFFGSGFGREGDSTSLDTPTGGE